MQSNFFKTVHKDVYSAFEALEPEKKFMLDEWRSALGAGVSAVIEGDVFEKGGVNFSHVSGGALPRSASERNPELAGHPFTAMGVSVVMHPHNPYVPTSHFNVRLLEVSLPQNKKHWWVGGGFDLTPYYGFEEDAILWHQEAKAACDPFGQKIYPEFKKWCDEYFYLKHRGEARGVGGIFFDDWNALSEQDSLKFLRNVTNAYITAYCSIVERRKNQPYGERERTFQAYRHGRYAEFNLVYDRGTLFGLQSGGRTESILMSLPRFVEWRYNWHPEKGSPEAKLYTDFLPIRDWV